MALRNGNSKPHLVCIINHMCWHARFQHLTLVLYSMNNGKINLAYSPTYATFTKLKAFGSVIRMGRC